MQIRVNSYNSIEKALLIMIALSNISMLDSYIGGLSLLSLAVKAGWGLIGVMLIRENDWQIPYREFLPILFFDVFCIMAYAIRFVIEGATYRKLYISYNLFKPINISAMVMLIAMLAAPYLTKEFFKACSRVYVITTIIAAALVISDTARSGFDLSHHAAIDAKNLLGIVFLQAILFLLRDIEFSKILKVGLLFLFTLSIVFTRSRAALIELIIIVVVYILFSQMRPLAKTATLVILGGLIAIIFTIPELKYQIVDMVLFKGEEEVTFNSFSSARDEQYAIFFNHFGDHPFIGSGWTFIECYPITTLMNYGIIGGLPILFFSLVPLFKSMKLLRCDDGELREIAFTTCMIAVTLLFNSLFEELAPFGPGVRCYTMWLFAGILLGKYQWGEGIE